MATDFAAFVAYNHAEYDVGKSTLDSTNAASVKAGSVVFYNTATDKVEECGANPALILGLATGTFASRLIYDGAKVPVIHLTPAVVVGMCSATTPVDAHVTRNYGIVRLASGNWAVNISDTVNTRLTVTKIDIAAGIFYCRFLAANLQGDSIVS